MPWAYLEAQRVLLSHPLLQPGGPTYKINNAKNNANNGKNGQNNYGSSGDNNGNSKKNDNWVGWIGGKNVEKTAEEVVKEGGEVGKEGVNEVENEVEKEVSLEDVMVYMSKQDICHNIPILLTMASVGDDLYWQLIENFVYTMVRFAKKCKK